MTKYIIPIFFILLIIAAGCASSSSSTQIDSGIRVSVSPGSATVAKGATAQFTASVSGTTTASVTWSVTGGSGYGTIDANGLYTPPATLPYSGTATVSASSNLDLTQSGYATVLLTRGNNLSFGTAVPVTDYDAGTYNATLGKKGIAIHEGSYYIYVVWSDNRSGNRDVYFTRSLDGGATFSVPIKVNDDGTSTDQYSPSIALSSEGVIYISWHDDRNAANDIYFSRSLDNGLTFSANTRVNDGTTTNGGTPVTAAGSGEDLFIVWNDTDTALASQNIYISTSTDGGCTFSNQVKVNTLNLGYLQPSVPDIAIDGNGNLGVVFASPAGGSANSDIYFTKSTNGGSTFSAEIKINDDGTNFNHESPALAVDSSNVIYVVWLDFRNNLPAGANDIYFSKSTDGGATFSANARVNDVAAGNAVRANPVIALDQLSNINILWADNLPGVYNTYFSSSNDGGQTFAAGQALDASTSDEIDASSTTDSSGRLLTIWRDFRNGTTNADIYMIMGE